MKSLCFCVNLFIFLEIVMFLWRVRYVFVEHKVTIISDKSYCRSSIKKEWSVCNDCT